MQGVRPFAMTAEDAASVIQGVLSSLKWAAKRMGCSTACLKLAFPLYGGSEGLTGDSPLLSAFSKATHVRGLRCLEYLPTTWLGTKDHAVELIDWLLVRAPRLEALSLDVRSTHLAAGSITFRHLKHLVMASSNLEGHSLTYWAAEVLPVLETLCINHEHTGREELPSLDLVGCRHLRQLVLGEGVRVQDVLKDPACRLGVHANINNVWPESSFEVQAALADQVSMDICNIHPFDMDPPAFAAFPCASTIHVQCLTADSSDGKVVEHFKAVPILHQCCMPANGDHVQTLRVLIMKAHRFKDCIPAGLPNLEELVISASSSLELSFEDVVSTFSILTKFYAFGKPLMPEKQDMVKLMSSNVLSRRNIMLSFSSVKADVEDSVKDSSCMYLQPTAAKGQSVEKLRDVVEQLVQCRCLACFDCLRRSGCLDY